MSQYGLLMRWDIGNVLNRSWETEAVVSCRGALVCQDKEMLITRGGVLKTEF